MRPLDLRVVVIFLAILACSVTTIAQSVLYKVIPIVSPFNPSDTVLGNDINNAGVLPLDDIRNGQQQAFEWKGNKGIPLTLFGGPCSTAHGINNASHIVGGACLPNESLPHAYVYRKGTTQDLGTFGGGFAVGMRVNRFDQTTGYYELGDGTDHTFFWNKKGWTDIGNLGGSYTYPFGINEAAVITGQSDISNNPDPVYGIPPFHGFQWSGGVLTDFGSIFGSNFNYGNAINQAGLISGSADVAGDTGAHAIIWNQGAVQDLTPGPAGFVAWGLDINSQGAVVGAFGQVDGDPADGPPVNTMLCPCYAMLWQNGQSIALQDAVPSGWSLLLALAINDKGEILARGSFNNGQLETVLLKPLKHPKLQGSGSSRAVDIRGRGLTYPVGAPRMIGRQGNGRLLEIR